MSNKTSKTAKEIGDRVEKYAAKILKGKKHKQSGGGKFIKLDVGDKEFVYSCKGTLKDRIVITSDMVREAIIGSHGPRGKQGSIPGLIIGLEDCKIVLCATLIHDHAAILTKEIKPYIVEDDKAVSRRKRANSSIL